MIGWFLLEVLLLELQSVMRADQEGLEKREALERNSEATKRIMMTMTHINESMSIHSEAMHPCPLGRLVISR